MPKEHHVIFVPGLGDGLSLAEIFVNRWDKSGLVPHIHRFGWKDNSEDFETKLNRLTDLIDRFDQKDNVVSLVGESAGGSAVLNAFLRRSKINAVVNLCGRLRTGVDVFPSLEIASRTSHAFKNSVETFEYLEPQMSVDVRRRILTLTPLWDEIVPKSTVYLTGADNRILPTFEHLLSGLLGVSVFSSLIINFVKSRAIKSL